MPHQLYGGFSREGPKNDMWILDLDDDDDMKRWIKVRLQKVEVAAGEEGEGEEEEREEAPYRWNHVAVPLDGW